MGKLDREKLAAAFKTFDKDGSNSLDKEELRAILQRPGTGCELDDESCDDLLEIFDENDDGVLSLEEFIDLMMSMEEDDEEDEADKEAEVAEEAEVADEADEADKADTAVEAADAAADETGSLPGWLEFELGVALDQLKARAPYDTDIDHPMITGPEGSFVLTMEIANEFCIEELEAAIADFVDTYDKVTNVVKMPLSDGYIFTAQNEPEIGGTNYWMQARRTIKGADGLKAYSIQTTAATPEQLANAVAFAKSVRAPRYSELL